MSKIVRLSEYREKGAVQAGFEFWHQRFTQSFDIHTRMTDLIPDTLCRLAEPGDDSTTAFYALIIGFLGYGEAMGFDALENKTQLRVLDIHLFLSDQIRFEVMHRIGWLAELHANQYALFEIVRQFDTIKAACQEHLPRLDSDHPRYKEYQGLIQPDKEVFIRCLLLPALEVFKQRFAL